MHEIGMSVALRYAQNAESCREHDAPRAGVVALAGAHRKRARGCAFDWIKRSRRGPQIRRPRRIVGGSYCHALVQLHLKMAPGLHLEEADETEVVAMTPDGRIVVFTIDERFDVALRLLRRALALEGLRVPCEVDTAARVKQELGVGLKQSVVLYVDDPIRLLEATVMNSAGGLSIPQPVVLSSVDQRSCRVSVRSIAPLSRAIARQLARSSHELT